MQIKQIEELLLQEMEEIKGGAVGTCNCKNGAAQGSTDEEVCNCDSGAAQRPSTNTDTPVTGPTCNCSGSGAAQTT